MNGVDEELICLAAHKPSDPLPRLVLADWLEDHDPDRSEFLRLACVANPDGAVSVRMEELLRLREKDWAGNLADHAHAWEFRQGLVEQAEGEEGLITPAAEAIWRKHPVRGLRLHVAPGSPFPEDTAWPVALHHLEIAGADSVARAWLPRLAGRWPATLRSLTLERCGIDTPAMRTLLRGGLTGQLHHLGFVNNRLLGDQALRVLTQEGAADLRSLSIHCANITPVGLGELFQAAPFPLLESLCVELAATFPMGPALKSLVPRLLDSPLANSLTRLEMHGLPLGPEGFLALVLSHHLNLRQVGLAHNRIGSEGAQFLTGGPGMDRVHTLNLAENDLETPHLQILARSGAWASLTHLDLRKNRITDEAIRSLLTEGPIGENLVHLNLRQNRIGGPGIQALSSFTRLRSLAIGGNYLNCETIGTLWKTTSLCDLEELDLIGTTLEEKALRVLRDAGHPTLRTLAINDHTAGMLVSKDCPGLENLRLLRMAGKPDLHLARKIIARTGVRQVVFQDEGRIWRRSRHAI